LVWELVPMSLLVTLLLALLERAAPRRVEVPQVVVVVVVVVVVGERVVLAALAQELSAVGVKVAPAVEQEAALALVRGILKERNLVELVVVRLVKVAHLDRP
jgi:hypothetical protein